MSGLRVPCAFCGRLIDPEHPRTWRFVQGWEQRRDAGGLHALALREPQQRWACSECIEKERRGVAAEQMRFT